MAYFNYCQGLTMTNRRFHRLFGGRPRRPESPLEQRHMDLAASIQAVTEDAVLRIGRHVHARTGLKHLVLAGGVALNCVANGRLLREGDFDDLWIQPAAGDAGGALGSALFVWHQLLEQPRRPAGRDCAAGELPRARASRPDQVARFLAASAPRVAPAALRRRVRAARDGRRTAGRRQGGRLVPGPHGVRPPRPGRPQHPGRSPVAGDAGHDEPQDQVPRELPAVRAGGAAGARRRVVRPRAGPGKPLHAAGRAGRSSERRTPIDPEALQTMQHDPDLRRRVNVVRSEVPAVTHVDYSARLQTVDEVRNPRFYRLIEAFDRLTGCPVLVNTSFNVRGEPIVCHARTTPIAASWPPRWTPWSWKTS